mmetsp:Transcript_115820/g.248876  ORF Transcript_115820/g.248876 Transcript_115820/m.248876 type:complete len:306 (-) Transcript_115820:3610-4527(-)
MVLHGLLHLREECGRVFNRVALAFRMHDYDVVLGLQGALHPTQTARAEDPRLLLELHFNQPHLEGLVALVLLAQLRFAADLEPVHVENEHSVDHHPTRDLAVQHQQVCATLHPVDLLQLNVLRILELLRHDPVVLVDLEQEQCVGQAGLGVLHGELAEHEVDAFVVDEGDLLLEVLPPVLVGDLRRDAVLGFDLQAQVVVVEHDVWVRVWLAALSGVALLLILFFVGVRRSVLFRTVLVVCVKFRLPTSAVRVAVCLCVRERVGQVVSVVFVYDGKVLVVVEVVDVDLTHLGFECAVLGSVVEDN